MKRPAFFVFTNDDGGAGGSPLPPTGGAPTPPAPAPRRASRLECEGCGCSLDQDGRILARGEGLKAHLDREDEVKRLKKALDEANESITELRAQVAALTPKPKRSILM